MSAKREMEETDGETPEPQTKRAKTNSSKTRQHQNSGIDPTWGQKYVFSSSGNATTIPAGEESEFEDDFDAMAYLMSVRKQASSIPHLLVAAPIQFGPQLPPGYDQEDESEEEGEPGQSKGFYEDGAYVGISEEWGVDIDQDDEPGEEDPEAIQKAVNGAYFASILSQYYRTREILHSKLPDNAASRLSRSQATEVTSLSPSTTRLWTRLLETTDPHPIQVALMSKDTVLKIIRVLIGGKFLQSGHSIPQRTSHWLWALLARLPDVGELNHTEIGWIRDLGRRAVLLGRSLAEMAALRDQLAEDGFGVNDNVDANSSDEEEGEDYHAPAADDATANGPPDTKNGIQDSPPAPITIPKDEVKTHVEGDGEIVDDGEIAKANEGSEDEDVAMDTGSDSSADEGEITEQADDRAALEEAKRKLLARLAESEHERLKEEERRNARINMRATLTMILTVAGEFYGQRDLLEFRKPFVGM
ncbi:hypothetical protein THARTR1_01140 [Trichoderma harzianum]|uniref:V-snare n=1 Tax=Trichoderma harzianum TaxID=5544 RepID=A0A2K0UMB5_TRIHA|nr:hypothetical protein THARTR1_01140 [Trichoderma harzianum]